MTEEEWAEWFTRAIDDILRGEEPAPAPTGLSGQDLESLLQVARLRLEAAQAAKAASAEYEPEVWQRLISRLETGPPPTAQPAVPDPDFPERDDEELRDIVALRMQMAREALEIAEAHKDDVWQRVRARVGDEAPGKRWLSMFPVGEAPQDPPTLAIPEGQRHGRRRTAPTDEAVLNEMAERAMTRLAEIAADPVQMKIRARMRGASYDALAQAQPEPLWPRLSAPLIAGLGAVVAIAVAVIVLVSVSAGVL